jgi:hypothetical protein
MQLIPGTGGFSLAASAQHVTATLDPPVITRQAAEVPFLAK